MVWSGQAEVPGRWPTPANWRWCTLSDVIINGKPEPGDARAKENLINDAGTLTIIFSGDLQNTKEIQATNKITLKEAKTLKLKQFTGRKLLVAGARQTMGRSGILGKGQTATINNVVHIITPDERYILLDFLFYYFLLQQTRSYLQKELAPNSSSISPDIMATAKVVVPSLPEQQRIIDRIEALTYDLEKSRTLLLSQEKATLTVLEQALTEVFSAQRISGWFRVVPIYALLTITSPQQRAGEQAYKNYPYIQTENIEPLTGRLLNLENIAANNLSENRKLYIMKNAYDILLYAPDKLEGSFSSIRKASMLQLEGAACHTDLFPLTILPQNPVSVLSDFIYWSLVACTPTSIGAGIRLGNVNITQTRLFNSFLPFPSNLHEQMAIVNQLNAVQDAIRKIREKQDEAKERLDQMKQNILEKAFRGLL